MKERKIIKALEKLTIYELNSFRKFLISPYFNQNEGCVVFFDMINEAIRSERDAALITGQEVWEKVYGDLPYNDVKLRKLSSDLFALFEDFIVQKEVENDKVLAMYLKLKAYKTRNIKDLFSSAINQVDNIQKTQTTKSSEYYLNSYNVQKTLMNFNLQSDIVQKKINLDEFINIDEISLNLDVFFISEKLRYYCTILSWNRSFNVKKKIIGIDIIIKLAQSPIFVEFPPIAIYYAITLTYTDENNEDHYYALRNLIDKHLHLFSKDEAKEIMEAALGYCITRGNKGAEKFEGEAFNLYKKVIKEDLIFLNDGSVSPREFRNIVFYALRLGEYEWAEDFIHDFAPYLDEKVRESNVNFSLARVEMHKKNYKKVIQLLAYTEYTEVFQALLSRNLLLAAYYELNEADSLESLFSSFKLYLDREKTLTKPRKSQYYHLIKFTKVLFKIKKGEKIKLEKLANEIKASEAVVNKVWLLEKIEEKFSF